jgi:hypothetical protein
VLRSVGGKHTIESERAIGILRCDCTSVVAFEFNHLFAASSQLDLILRSKSTHDLDRLGFRHVACLRGWWGLRFVPERCAEDVTTLHTFQLDDPQSCEPTDNTKREGEKFVHSCRLSRRFGSCVTRVDVRLAACRYAPHTAQTWGAPTCSRPALDYLILGGSPSSRIGPVRHVRNNNT